MEEVLRNLIDCAKPLTLNDLAIVEMATGTYDEAEQLFRATLAMQRELLGEEHEDIPDALNNRHFPDIIATPDKPYSHWCEFEIA